MTMALRFNVSHGGSPKSADRVLGAGDRGGRGADRNSGPCGATGPERGPRL